MKEVKDALVLLSKVVQDHAESIQDDDNLVVTIDCIVNEIESYCSQLITLVNDN